MPATGVHCSAPSVLWHCPLLRCTHALPFLRATAGCLARPFACLAYARGAGAAAPQKRPSRCAPLWIGQATLVRLLCTEGGYTLTLLQAVASQNAADFGLRALSPDQHFPRHWPPPPRPARCARGLRHGSQILFQENKAQVPSLYRVQCTLLLARTHATPGHGLAESRSPPVLPPKSPARTVRPAPQHATHASEAVVFRHVLHALGVAHHLVQL